jgi:ascorbate-specific PTS system EIIC-type component UlaA
MALPLRDGYLYLRSIINIVLRALIVAYSKFLTIVAIAVIVGIVKNPYHNDITKYVTSVTKTSQMKQLTHFQQVASRKLRDRHAVLRKELLGLSVGKCRENLRLGKTKLEF